MTSLKLMTLLLFAVCLGYAAAYIPGLQIPLALHRWHPMPALATAPSLSVQGIGWVGTRTPYFDNTVTFFRDVLKLPLSIESSQFAEFTLAGGERLGIFGAKLPDTGFMKGPMMEFVVADVREARSQLETLGVQFIGEIHGNPDTGIAWTEFWGPDGHPYGLTSTAQARPQHRVE
jgi:predicted enzyme related to lactoylglutathione lyase